MTQLLDQERIGAYTPPALEPLGPLRDLTKGAGPGGELIVMASVGVLPEGLTPAPATPPPFLVQRPG
jgi:hypothetical protein